MIDLEREKLLTMGQAAELLPRRRGRQPAATTVWRWCVKGWRGVRLDALRTPAGWVTSAEAVARFLAALADLDRGRVNRNVAAEVEAAKARRTWADRVLDEAGVGRPSRRQRTRPSG